MKAKIVVIIVIQIIGNFYRIANELRETMFFSIKIIVLSILYNEITDNDKPS